MHPLKDEIETMTLSKEEAAAAKVADVRTQLNLPFPGSCPECSTRSLSSESIHVGKHLGTGSFSSVFAVTLREDFAEEKELSVSSISDHDTNKDSGDPGSSNRSKDDSLQSQSLSQRQYALKRLNKKAFSNQKVASVAIRDILFEAEILSKLPFHENIIQLHGTSHGFWNDPLEGFLVIERVQETLSQRLYRWKLAAKYDPNAAKKSLFFLRLKDPHRRLKQQHRVKVCVLGLARALKFLHQHGIVYRDLKPANIGFMHDGKVKLFDLGLARTPTTCHSDMRQLTGSAGTARYMAPEVALHQNYGFPVDVHSFGLILWQICTLQKPYANISSLERLRKNAVIKHVRPSCREVESSILKELLKTCWDPVPEARPSFVMIEQQLKLEISMVTH